MNHKSRSDAFCWNSAYSSSLMSLRSFGEQHITAHTRKAKLFRQSESFASFTKFVSTKAFRSSFLALQVCAKRYVKFARIRKAGEYICIRELFVILEALSLLKHNCKSIAFKLQVQNKPIF
jgi:hypothetical protein